MTITKSSAGPDPDLRGNFYGSGKVRIPDPAARQQHTHLLGVLIFFFKDAFTASLGCSLAFCDMDNMPAIASLVVGESAIKNNKNLRNLCHKKGSLEYFAAPLSKKYAPPPGNVILILHAFGTVPVLLPFRIRLLI